MKVNEIFYSLQGEIDVGVPSVFVRSAFCNLNCSFCDTDFKRGKNMSVEEIVDIIKTHKSKNIIFTGGEPLLWCEDIDDIIYSLNEEEEKYTFGIETNGTIYHPVLKSIDRVVVSPKNINPTSLRPEKLKQFPKDAQYKFVYQSELGDWWEELIQDVGIDKNNVWIMPEGATYEEQLEHMNDVADYCLKTGYKMTPRLHTLLWSNSRGK